MRLALYQGPRLDPVPDRPADARDRCLDAIAQAAAAAALAGADLLVCPEMSATGYVIGAAVARALAEPCGGPMSERLGQVAADNGIAIAYGYPEAADGNVYNAVRVVGAGGATLADYRKCQLFGDLDRGMFTAGGDPLVQFDCAGLRLGVLICYDVEFPELVRAHALAGADVVIVPTGLMAPHDIISSLLVPARALENQLFLAYANRCDTQGSVRFVGASCVVGPDGRDIARAGPDEQLLYADLDVDLLRQSRVDNPYLADRRPDLYPRSPVPPAAP